MPANRPRGGFETTEPEENAGERADGTALGSDAPSRRLADVFHIETETADAITGFYPDRETVGPPVSYSMRAVLARFPTLEAARAAREGAVAEWRKHDAGVQDAEVKLREAEKAREDAWLKCLRDAAER